METLKVQAQIRQNSEEISSYLADLSKWEKQISTRDQALRKAPQPTHVEKTAQKQSNDAPQTNVVAAETALSK
jgi:hypothetical protein